MIKAIETAYKGYRFRSRLEARWAVFFDALGLRWEYEPEGFELPDGTRYLPDFFVHCDRLQHKWPGAGYWVEIKGIEPTPEERRKIRHVCMGTGHHGYCMTSQPGDFRPISVSLLPPKPTAMSIEESEARAFIWSMVGDQEDIDYLWHSGLLMCRTTTVEYDEYVAAVNAARGARFEHGECGAVA